MNTNSPQNIEDNYVKWKGWVENQSFGKCDDVTAAYYRAELIASRAKLSKNSSVLEIGFGNGEFAAFCRAAGFDYTGTEINELLIDAGREAGFSVLTAQDALTDLAKAQRRFDLVTAFDVFEHLEVDHLLATLLEISSILKPDGMLISRVPSGDSPFARAIQHGDLTHLGTSALTQLALETGYTLTQAREPVFIYSGLRLGSWLRRCGVQLVRRLTFPIMQAAYFSGGDVVLTQNLIAVFVLRSHA